MQWIKRRTFAGNICVQEVYPYENARQMKSAEPRMRFKNESEREQHKLNISRKKFALLVNANFSPTSLYSTLTFSSEYEAHDFIDAHIMRDRFWKKVRRQYPEAVMVICMGRGKGTNRIHLHMISEGLPEEAINRLWIYGDIAAISHLREHNLYDGIDHGQDYTSLANYLFNHWTPEQGGHRWKATRNAKKPEREEPKPCTRLYSETKPPQAPRGYVLVSVSKTKYGYTMYTYVVNPALQGMVRKRYII